MLTPPPFSKELQKKIDDLAQKKKAINLGHVNFSSPLLLAPMAGITDAPFRLLMQDLGSGGSVTELISSNGAFYQNERTLNMMHVHPQEKNVGVQIFGEHPEHMAFAAQYAEKNGANFVDINMGCPVRKVVTKGGGAALMQEPDKLYDYLSPIKKAIKIPLTIKIRTGWDQDHLTAKEIIKVAKDIGVEFVAIHGRTRVQAYKGFANWDYLEEIKKESPLPIIGNGDLHTPYLVRERLNVTSCDALMLGRGPLRNPFLFLEGLLAENEIEEFSFRGQDYGEAFTRLQYYFDELVENERWQMINLRKLVVWFAAGFKDATQFRGKIFTLSTIQEVMDFSLEYFHSIRDNVKKIDMTTPFMQGGHG